MMTWSLLTVRNVKRFTDVLNKIKESNCFSNTYKSQLQIRSQHYTTSNEEPFEDETIANNILNSDEKFRVLQLTKKKFEKREGDLIRVKNFSSSREKIQPVTQDWGNVWPGIRSFHPATVPLPVRMGYPYSDKPSPGKWGNAELMKIPNFLHLTPPVVERQCEAIKKFCTEWPKELESEESQDYFFPITVKTSSYLHSSTSIRDPRSRCVTLSISLESLELDYHAMDKLLRIVGDRYNPETKILTLKADCCPLSSQNLDYCIYLLTVIYNESLKMEPWEHEKQDEDRERFQFEESTSKKAIVQLQEVRGESLPQDTTEIYKEAVTKLHNEGENEETVNAYTDAVMKIIKLKSN